LLQKFEDVGTAGTYSTAEFFNDHLFKNYTAPCFPHISVLLNRGLLYRAWVWENLTLS